MSSQRIWPRFIAAIWAINGVLFLGGLIAMGGFLIVNGLNDAKRRGQANPGLQAVTDQQVADERWTLGEVIETPGFPVIRMELRSSKLLTEDAEAEPAFIGSGSASYRGQRAKNIIFIQTETGDRQWLFKANQQLIIRTHTISSSVTDGVEELAQVLIYSIIRADSNSDGVLDRNDRITIGASDPGGGGYTVLLPDVQKLIGLSRIDANSLLVVYQADNQALTAELDLSSLTLGSALALPVVGE